MPLGRGSLTDGELIERLKLLQEHKGNRTKAAGAYGISVRNFQMSLAQAKQRGLTAATKTIDTEGKLRTKVKILEQELAFSKHERDTAESIRTEIYKLEALTPDPPRWLLPKAKHKSGPGIPMTIWSDFHWGETVVSAEVGGANSFNRKIAKERLRKLVQTTIDLTLNHMVKPQYEGIVVCLGGDMVSGDIHEELEITNDGYLQQSLLEVQEELIAAIRILAEKFKRVFIPCVVGNHGRMTKKRRAKGRVFTSYEWNLYCQLELFFKNDKRVQFMIPGEADAYFSVNGHRFLLTHGDSLGVKGGNGEIGALGPITRGRKRIGYSESYLGRDFDTMVMGHYHTYVPRSDASAVIVNGALKGYDEYARLELRVPPSRPSQALWFVHPEHGITCQWQMFLDAKRNFKSSDWVTWAKQDKSISNSRSLAA